MFLVALFSRCYWIVGSVLGGILGQIIPFDPTGLDFCMTALFKMDELGFGNCTNTGACQAECPKAISIAHIARLNREFLSAKFED